MLMRPREGVPRHLRSSASWNAGQKKGRYSTSIFSRIHLGLGDRERALDYLEKAAATRDPWLLFHYRDQRFDSLRTDVRFVALYRGLGLPFDAN